MYCICIMVRNFRYTVIQYVDGNVVNEFDAKNVKEIVKKVGMPLHIIRSIYLKKVKTPRRDLADAMKLVDVIIIE